MKKHARIWLLLLCFTVMFSMPVFAADQRVFDDAGLLKSADISSLETTIADYRQQLSVDFVVVTTNDTGGKTTRKFADDYYDSNSSFGVGADHSGVLLLIDMDNRQATISTTGKMIDYLTDSRITSILNQVTSRLKQKDYKGAVQTFLTQTKSYVKQGVPNDQYRYDEDTGKVTERNRSLSTKDILISLAVSVGVGAICVACVAAKYKLHFKDYKYPAREKGHTNLKSSQDVFLSRNVTSHVIQSNNNSGGGGSSTHSSSSGTTHGGGSQGF